MTMCSASPLLTIPPRFTKGTGHKISGPPIRLTRAINLTQEIYANHRDLSTASFYAFEGTLTILPVRAMCMPRTFEVSINKSLYLITTTNKNLNFDYAASN